MKLFLFSALAATLCAAPALAQPQEGGNMFPRDQDNGRKVKPRPAEVNLQIKQDLEELVATLKRTKANVAARSYVYGAREGYFGSNEWMLLFNFYAGDIQIKDVKVLERNGDDVKATISYSFLATPNNKASKTQMENQQETLNFKLVQLSFKAKPQAWQIVPPATKPPMINAENNDVLWANISYHIAQKENYKPDGTPAERSIDNLKQLGLGALQFVMDYDEIYAFEPRYLSEALAVYVGNKMIFHVPDTNEIYAFNANLSGNKADNTRKLTQTVMFYEGQNETPIFRYDGKAAICFADGHVALVTPDEAQKLIWKP